MKDFKDHKEYKVNFWYKNYGITTVFATDKKQAEKLVMNILHKDGLEGLFYDNDDRDYDTTLIEEVKS